MSRDNGARDGERGGERRAAERKWMEGEKEEWREGKKRKNILQNVTISVDMQGLCISAQI